MTVGEAVRTGGAGIVAYAVLYYSVLILVYYFGYHIAINMITPTLKY